MPPIYDIEIFRPSQAVGAYIGRASRTLAEAIDQKLAPLDISHAQWIVVMVLGDGSPARLESVPRPGARLAPNTA